MAVDHGRAHGGGGDARRGGGDIAPFLPLPTVGYLRLRAVTQYGDATAVPSTDDVARYLDWCREMRRHDLHR